MCKADRDVSQKAWRYNCTQKAGLLCWHLQILSNSSSKVAHFHSNMIELNCNTTVCEEFKQIQILKPDPSHAELTGQFRPALF